LFLQWNIVKIAHRLGVNQESLILILIVSC
jgi:hypothetical protein